MDNMNISVTGIEEGINYIEKEVIERLHDEMEKVKETYSNFISNGTLSSSEVDELLQGVIKKTDSLQMKFEEVATKIKTTMTQSSEGIQKDISGIHSNLSN